MDKKLTINQGEEIIEIVVDKTRPVWEEWIDKESYEDIDDLFLMRGYEQLGFDSSSFVKLVDEEGIKAIGDIGSILVDIKRYNREYAGPLESPFYKALKEGDFGDTGEKFYNAVEGFYVNPEYKKGGKFGLLIWQMLSCCTYLKDNYRSSFLFYLKKKVGDYLERGGEITDEEFKTLDEDTWEGFLETEPWSELDGIGENTFPYILSDVREFKFKDSPTLIKLDAANANFTKHTGIINLADPSIEDDRRRYIDAIEKVRGNNRFREVNSAVYVFSSVGYGKEYGGPCSIEKCENCDVRNLCPRIF